MGFWIFMFVCNIIIPITMIVFGWFMWKKPPGSINSICGYRTAMSMKNKDTWLFAHDCCGRLWWKVGWGLLPPSIIVQLPFTKSNEDVIGWLGFILCMIQCVALFASIIPVEKALKKTFDKNGNRRNV